MRSSPATHLFPGDRAGAIFWIRTFSRRRSGALRLRGSRLAASAPAGGAFLSALTIGEIVQGIVRAPVERQPALQTWLAQVREAFAGRILPLDAAVMEGWGRLTGGAGPGMSALLLEAMLAATPIHHRLVLVTRNARHFQERPLPLVDPFAEAAER